MTSDIRAQNHLNYDLSHVPVLSLGQQLENVVLGVKQELKGDCAVMVLQNLVIIVPESLLMLNTHQEVVCHARMRYIMQQTRQKAGHDLQI